MQQTALPDIQNEARTAESQEDKPFKSKFALSYGRQALQDNPVGETRIRGQNCHSRQNSAGASSKQHIVENQDTVAKVLNLADKNCLKP